MNDFRTKENFEKMTSSSLAKQLKKDIWGSLPSASVQSDLIEEAINRLDNDAACITDHDYQENIDWAHRSYREALNNEAVHCRGCEEKFSLLRLFRCFHCGSFFCPACARVHFGGREGAEPSGLVVCKDMDCEKRGDCLHAEHHSAVEECRFICDAGEPCSRCHPVEEAI